MPRVRRRPAPEAGGDRSRPGRPDRQLRARLVGCRGGAATDRAADGTATGLAVTDAYRIQQINVTRRTRRGQRVIGHKIGLTARAMQDLFGVSEPDYGHLMDTMLQDPGRRST